MKFHKNVKIILNVLFVFISINLFSQQSIILGIVQDSVSKEVISYAAVYIKNSNDSVVYNTYSDENGKFKLPFSAITNASFNVEILGYKKFFKENMNLNGEYDFKILLLPDTEILGEVEITDSANKVTHKIDRDIHKISEQQIKKSQNIYDILKTLPGVIVDENNNTVYFKGSTPEILVDNMPTSILYPDLRAINIKDVEKIELIDKSSIYGGSGEGGIINIKLKKEKEKVVGMYFGTDCRYGIKDNVFSPDKSVFNLNFNIGKIMIINNFIPYVWVGKETITQNQNIFVKNTYYDRESEENSFYKQWLIGNVFGIIIPVGKFQILLADQIAYSKSRNNRNFLQNTFQNDTNIFYLHECQYDIFNFFRNQAIAQITANDFKNQDLSFTFNYYKIFELLNQSVINQQHINLLQSIQDHNQYKKNYNSDLLLYSSDAYYIYHISQTSQINVHGQFLHCGLPNNSLNYFINDVEAISYAEKSDAKIQDLVSGLNYSKRLKKFSIDFTANYHFKRIVGDFFRNINSKDTIFNLNLLYHLVEPSIRFRYFVNDENNFYLGYNYKTNNINFENYKAIEIYIPYIDKTNPYSWKSGNQNLKQELYHYIYFKYQLNIKSFFLNTEIFYKQTNNLIDNIRIPITNEITLSMSENIAFYNRIGIDFSFHCFFYKNWKLGFTSNTYHSLLKTNDLNLMAEQYQILQKKITSKGFGINLQTYIQYNFNSKKMENPNIILWIDYNSKEITFTGYNNQYFNANIAFKTNVYKKKINLALALENFLSPFIHKQSFYDYLGIVTNTDYYSYSNNIRLKFSLGFHIFAGDRGSKDFKL